jgi:hypothetical protein
MTRTSATSASASVRPARAATARGYRIRDFCEREGISRATCWNWARKGVVVLSRLDRAVGVRVLYADRTFDDDPD